jgi:hypothetical protein
MSEDSESSNESKTAKIEDKAKPHLRVKAPAYPNFNPETI